MAPCVVVERLVGKQWCSRAAVGEHAGIQAREWTKWLFTRNEGSMKNNQPPRAAHHANHDSVAPRQHPLICTGAEPIHQVHGSPKLRAPESMLRNRITFPPFSRRFHVGNNHWFPAHLDIKERQITFLDWPHSYSSKCHARHEMLIWKFNRMAWERHVGKKFPPAIGIWNL